MASRALGLLLTLILPFGSLGVGVLAPVPAGAAAQPAADEEAGDDADEGDADAEPSEEIGGEPAVEEAKALFTEGAGKFETADYAGAIELWTKAYSIVPNRPEYAPIKAKLIANLASARERAYAVDEEVTHLNQAKILLERYREEIDVIYTSSIEREKELAWVNERLAKIEAELEARAERDEAQRGRGEPGERRLAPGQGLMIGGGVLVGLGAAGLGVMAGGMVMGVQGNDISNIPSDDLEQREAQFARGRTGNALAIAGAAGGAVLIGAGVALLVVGMKKKKAAGAEAPAQAVLAPVLGPGQLGVGLSGRF